MLAKLHRITASSLERYLAVPRRGIWQLQLTFEGLIHVTNCFTARVALHHHHRKTTMTTGLWVGLGAVVLAGMLQGLFAVPMKYASGWRYENTRPGHTYLLGTGIMLVGIAVCARAGMLREAAHTQAANLARGSFLAGVTVCCLSGLFSSALNFSYAFGGEAIEHALALRATTTWSTGVVTALAVTGRFLANFAYCAYLLTKNGTIARFTGPGSGVAWFCGGLMGLFWFGGQSLYGLGISHMGGLGVVIGWPLLMGMIIVTSNAAGIFTGEWSGVSVAAKRFLAGGIAIILGALAILAL